MISLSSIPERIIDGSTLKVKLEINGQINIKMYKGTYFNLILKKNGSTLSSTTLYPLRFNGFPLEWEINPNSYGSSGTFNVNCIIQDSSQITSTTFIVEPDCIVKKINTCNNITSIEQTNRFKETQVKKQEIPIDFMGGCLVQKPGKTLNEIEYEKKHKQSHIINQVVNEYNNTLLSSVKVQKASRNVNGI